MNFKKITLITLLLLAVLTIGAVSASEDIASDDNLAVSDLGDEDLSDSPVDDGDLLSDDDGGDEPDDNTPDENDPDENGTDDGGDEDNYQANITEEFDVDDEDAVVFSLVCPDEATGKFVIQVGQDDDGKTQILNTVEHEIIASDYNKTISWTAKELKITEAGYYSILAFHLVNPEDQVGDETLIFDDTTYAYDANQFRLVESYDEVNCLDLNKPFIILYCPDGKEGIVNITVEENEKEQTFTKNLSAKDENNYLKWTISELNMTSVGDYEISIDVNEGEFERDLDVVVCDPIEFMIPSFTSSIQKNLLRLVVVELPTAYTEGRIIIVVDDDEIFNKTLAEFKNIDDTNDSYYWHHPRYGPGPADEDHKHYTINNAIIPNLEAKTYNVTAILIVDDNQFIENSEVAISEGNVVENDNVSIELGHEAYEINSDPFIVYITAPDGANGNVVVTYDGNTLVNKSLSKFEKINTGAYYYVITPKDINITEPGSYYISVAYWDGDNKVVENNGTIVFIDPDDGEEEEEYDGMLYIDTNNIIIDTEVVGLNTEKEMDSGRLVVFDIDTGVEYFNKTLAEMEYNTNWMKYKANSYDGYYIFCKDLNIPKSGVYNINATYYDDAYQIIETLTGKVTLDKDSYFIEEDVEIDITDNDTILIAVYVFDFYKGGNITVGEYVDAEDGEIFVSLYNHLVADEDIGTVINITRKDLDWGVGSKQVYVLCLFEDDDIGICECEINIVDNTQFRIKMDDDLSIFESNPVISVYCPLSSANTNITIVANNYNLTHLITESEAGNYINFTLSELNVTAVETYEFNILDNEGNNLTETYEYEFSNPFIFSDECIMDTDDDQLLQFRTPEGFSEGRIVITDDDGNVVFNKTLTDMNHFTFGWEAGYMRYEVCLPDLNMAVDEGTYTFHASYIGDISVFATADVLVVKQNIIEKDNVTIELIDYKSHNVDDDEEAIAKVTSPNGKGYVIAVIDLGGGKTWSDTFAFEDDDGEYICIVTVDGGFAPGTYPVTVSYFDEDDNLILNSTANMTFYGEDDDSGSAELIYNSEEISTIGDETYNATTFVVGIVLDKPTAGILSILYGDEDLVVANIPDNNETGVWSEYQDGRYVYYVYLKNVSFKNVGDGDVIEVIFETDNTDLERSIDLNVEVGDNYIKFSEVDPNEGAQYIYLTDDDVNPSFDVNLETNAGGSLVLVENGAEIYTWDLSDIAEYSDEDGRWHHDIQIDTDVLDEGNHTITLIYKDIDGNILENRTFNITVEDEGSDEAKPEIFVMYSNHPDDNEVIYYLTSDDMIHIYPNDDDSENIRIVVVINGEVYLNKTIEELKLPEKTNDEDDTYYTVGPVHFDKAITPGYYDDVVAYYYSEEYTVNSTEGNLPNYATIYWGKVIAVIEDTSASMDNSNLFRITAPIAANGRVILYIGDAVYFNKTLSDMDKIVESDPNYYRYSFGPYNVETLTEGTYQNAVLCYYGDDGFNFNSTQSYKGDITSFTLTRLDSQLTINVNDVEQGTPALIVVTTNPLFSGNVSVAIGDANCIVAVVNGTGNETIALPAGPYTAVATFAANRIFNGAVKEDAFNVTPKAVVLIDPELTINIANIVEGEDAFVMIGTNANFSGTVDVQMGTVTYAVTVTNGNGHMAIPYLTEGDYTAVATFAETEVFASSVKTADFTVGPKPVVLVDPELTISVANIVEGADANVIVTTNNAFSGNVGVQIGAANYNVAIVNGAGNITLSGLAVGNYTAVATFAETDKYAGSVKEATFSVTAGIVVIVDPKLTIDVADIAEGADASVVITTNATFSGDVIVQIGDAKYVVTITSGNGNKTISGLTEGNYTAVATLTATGNFASSVKNTTFIVGPKPVVLVDPELTISIASIVEGADAVVVITTDAAFSGDVYVQIGNATYPVSVVNGTGNWAVSGLTVGNYVATATFNETDKYTRSVKEATFSVSAEPVVLVDPELTISVANIAEGRDANVIITTNAAFSGDVNVQIGDAKYAVSVVNGTGNRAISGLTAGSHTAVATFTATGNFASSVKNTTFTVAPKPVKINPDLTIVNISNVEQGSDVLIIINANPSFSGNVAVQVGNYTTSVAILKGSGNVSVSTAGFDVGPTTVVVTSSENSYFNAGSASATFNVTEKPVVVPVKIVAKALTMQYSSGKKYSVTVYGTDGKVAKGVVVVFKIKGKQVAKVKTNSKGVATFKPKQVPGTYKISATALGKTVTKKLKVKQVLKLKKVKVKKSAKKLVLKATLVKVNKKYLRGKKITFKFNGKKYKAKTNKKGVAKVTIKKKVLKKLKVGKKVKYQATYIKATVKKSVKVKK